MESPRTLDHGVDWTGWWHAWERVMRGYLPQREGCLATLGAVLGQLVGERPRLLDLGAGTGAASAALLDRLPRARCVAVEFDPVLAEVGRRTLGTAGGCLRWVDADLRDPAWVAAVDGPFDAIASLAVLHMLPRSRQAELYAELWRLLSAGGVLLIADFVAPDGLRMRGAIESLETGRAEAAVTAGTARSFAGWWDEIAAEPELGSLLSERARRLGAGSGDHVMSAGEHAVALSSAGFTEVDTVWQDAGTRLFAALR